LNSYAPTLASLSSLQTSETGVDRFEPIFNVGRATTIPPEILMFLVALALLTFFWDFFERKSRGLEKNVGLEKGAKVLELKDQDTEHHGLLFDAESGIKSQPDAIVEEQGHRIPVDIVTTSSKIQDRHVIKIITHLFLMERETGVRPPYGILRMGRKGRIVHISNTDEKQEWLANVVSEMREIERGEKKAKASPQKKKCQFCEISEKCEHRYKS